MRNNLYIIKLVSCESYWCMGNDFMNTRRERRWNVYYTVYIDILFMVNLMMDYLLLCIVKKITKCETSFWRLLLASTVGSFLMCVIIVIPLPYTSIKILLFHIVINTIMIKLGFRISNKVEFIKCFLFLYIGAFLLGGVFQYFQQYIKISSLFFLMALSSYVMVCGIWHGISCFCHQREKWYHVQLFLEGKSIVVKALLDTGNGLYNPYNGKAVHIIKKQVLIPILPQTFMKGIHYIPYHSLGNQGVMMAIKIEKMYVEGEVNFWVKEPWIALSEEEISTNNSYQMILNSDIF